MTIERRRALKPRMEKRIREEEMHRTMVRRKALKRKNIKESQKREMIMRNR